ncbi:hypothetical protein [Mycobacterium decipiens]|uniref:hypothetical protein n=1 Tax=Mycobacterium decipiens TaxID=1430326 RepID=UPI0013FDB0B1|nr:hypothetical protein [Mycobacterium decipiens]
MNPVKMGSPGTGKPGELQLPARGCGWTRDWGWSVVVAAVRRGAWQAMSGPVGRLAA